MIDNYKAYKYLRETYPSKPFEDWQIIFGGDTMLFEQMYKDYKAGKTQLSYLLYFHLRKSLPLVSVEALKNIFGDIVVGFEDQYKAECDTINQYLFERNMEIERSRL